MNRRLHNAIAGLTTARRVAAMATLVVSTSLAMGTATAHAAVDPSPTVSPSPTSIYTPNLPDLVITKTTWNSFTIYNDGPVPTGVVSVFVASGVRQGDPRKCTTTTLVGERSWAFGSIGPYQSVTRSPDNGLTWWATNERYIYVDFLELVRESDENNNWGTIPGSVDLRPNQCPWADLRTAQADAP